MTRVQARSSASLIIGRLLAVQPGEQVALVCDDRSAWDMVDALVGAVTDAGAEATVLTMPRRETDRKNDLTPPVERALEAADCLIGLTGAGGAPTYSSTVKRLLDAKSLRAMSMVMRTMENYTSGGALADYDLLHAEGLVLQEGWRAAERIRVTTPAGTDFASPIAGEDVIVECGFATEGGQEAAFSDGEVSQMPTEGKAQGRIVVDGPIAHLGPPSSPITLDVVDGRVVQVTGASGEADALREIVTTVQNADNIAEVGIGLNPMCRRNGDFEEEKKARGLVHIAIGDNVFYGGTVRCAVHMDMVLYQPTVWLDDAVIVEGGSIRLPGSAG